MGAPHAVNQRRREIGIRMALGASARDVLRHVVWNAMWMVLLGLGIGLVGALTLTRVMRTLLFEVSALDPIAFAVAAFSMVLVAVFAALIPASRASRVNPVTRFAARLKETGELGSWGARELGSSGARGARISTLSRISPVPQFPSSPVPQFPSSPVPQFPSSFTLAAKPPSVRPDWRDRPGGGRPQSPPRQRRSRRSPEPSDLKV